jgi:hypothetical protein
MVADSHDNYTFSFRSAAYTWFLLCTGTLYLFFILIMKISKEQQSVIGIAAGFLLIAWLKHNDVFFLLAGMTAIAFPFPLLNKPMHKSWMALSKILGWISSHCILFILFYGLLTPISLLRKLLGKQDMQKNFPGKDNSAFYQRDHIYGLNDFLNPW